MDLGQLFVFNLKTQDPKTEDYIVIYDHARMGLC